MEITKSEFQDWTTNLVTKEVMRVIEARVEDAKDILSVSAGDNSYQDAILVGMIKAFREVGEISYDD
jgi:hypothetical protein